MNYSSISDSCYYLLLSEKILSKTKTLLLFQVTSNKLKEMMLINNNYINNYIN